MSILSDVGPLHVEHATDRYGRAQPFPHVVLDGWFDDAALADLEARYLEPDGWRQYAGRKRGLMTVADHPVVQSCQSGEVLELVRTISGQPVVSDPTLRGGGLHVVKRGGRLGIHVDFNRHPKAPIRRAVNTILYLNRDWNPAWNGALTLTDRDTTTTTLAPLWNRWVIFEYSHHAWHGHPEPLECPEDRERRSLAIYYYLPMTPDQDRATEFHTTIYERDL